MLRLRTALSSSLTQSTALEHPEQNKFHRCEDLWLNEHSGHLSWVSVRFKYRFRFQLRLSTDTTKALVHAFVTSRVDYCYSLLYGLPASHLNKVQRVLNAAARLVCRAPRYCCITPLMYELHWLPVRQRISFKILLFVFKAIHGFAPTYLRELVSIKRSGNYNLTLFRLGGGGAFRTPPPAKSW